MNYFWQELQSFPKVEKFHLVKYYHKTKELRLLIATVKKSKVIKVETFDTDDEDIDMTLEIVNDWKVGDERMSQEIMWNFVEKAVKTGQKNPLPGCINIELGVDVNDVFISK